MSDALEALLAAPPSARALRDELRARVAAGDAIPGFGHPMYPKGDPRAAHLLAIADALGARGDAAERLRDALSVLRDVGHAPPNLDAGLVALRLALGLPRGSAAGIFALGRAAGWAAHAMEQRDEPETLRPRARAR